jgi:hypothetical protein
LRTTTIAGLREMPNGGMKREGRVERDAQSLEETARLSLFLQFPLIVPSSTS